LSIGQDRQLTEKEVTIVYRPGQPVNRKGIDNCLGQDRK
jgi:hypothetical protein